MIPAPGLDLTLRLVPLSSPFLRSFDIRFVFLSCETPDGDNSECPETFMLKPLCFRTNRKILTSLSPSIRKIELKGAIRDFLQSPHCAANCFQHARSSAPAQSCANHVQHTEHSSRETCRVPLGKKRQLSYLGSSFCILSIPLSG